MQSLWPAESENVKNLFACFVLPNIASSVLNRWIPFCVKSDYCVSTTHSECEVYRFLVICSCARPSHRPSWISFSRYGRHHGIFTKSQSDSPYASLNWRFWRSLSKRSRLYNISCLRATKDQFLGHSRQRHSSQCFSWSCTVCARLTIYGTWRSIPKLSGFNFIKNAVMEHVFRFLTATVCKSPISEHFRCSHLIFFI